MEKLDARKFPIYHVVNISPSESHIVTYVNSKNGPSKVWKKFNPKIELVEEDYNIMDDSLPRYYLDLSQNNQEKDKGKDKEKKTCKKTTSYQQFIKDKTEEYSNLYQNLSKKERYNLILEEWKKNKN